MSDPKPMTLAEFRAWCAEPDGPLARMKPGMTQAVLRCMDHALRDGNEARTKHKAFVAKLDAVAAQLLPKFTEELKHHRDALRALDESLAKRRKIRGTPGGT